MQGRYSARIQEASFNSAIVFGVEDDARWVFLELPIGTGMDIGPGKQRRFSFQRSKTGKLRPKLSGSVFDDQLCHVDLT